MTIRQFPARAAASPSSVVVSAPARRPTLTARQTCSEPANGLTLVVEWAPNCSASANRAWFNSGPAIGKEGRHGHARGNLRFHRHRGRIGRLRGGGPPLRVWALSGAAARGWPPRPPSLDPHPDRLSQALYARDLQLEVRKRTGLRTQRPH